MKHARFLILVLRHKPELIALDLDAHGWAKVSDVLKSMKAAGREIGIEALREIVAADDKGRFTLSDDGKRIRAAQGHSLALDLGLPSKAPPAVLYHGTAGKYLDAIYTTGGLCPQKRDHVHLSSDTETALKVGARHGNPVIMVVDAAGMSQAGHQFFQADNGVWLTSFVPVRFLSM